MSALRLLFAYGNMGLVGDATPE